MRKFFSIILFILVNVSIASDAIVTRSELIISFMNSNPDSAIAMSHELMAESWDKNHEFGVVQSNYILGYIYDKIQVDYSNAIIFYLEAIRYAENSEYQNVSNDLISLYKNCGVIFRKFNAFDLAIEYYEKSLSLAKDVNDEDQIVSISYNMAGLFSEMNRKLEAIELLEEISNQLESKHPKYFNLNNRLSQIYLDANQFLKAKSLTQKILEAGEPGTRELIDSYQILGRVALIENQPAEAEKYFEIALQTALLEKEDYIRDKALFETFSDLGTLNLLTQNSNQAIDFFLRAEKLIDKLPQKPDYFKVYKLLANCYFEKNLYAESKKYEDLYSESLNNFLKTQEDIQETDRRYNMDLITKRYFDEVAKQEKIATILFYSKLISGTLLALLLFTIGFNWYQKVKLRKNLVRDLMALKMID